MNELPELCDIFRRHYDIEIIKALNEDKNDLRDPFGGELLKVGTKIRYNDKLGEIIGYDGETDDGFCSTYIITLDKEIHYVYYKHVEEELK